MVDFDVRLKKLRLQNDMTQLELARKIGVSKSVISAYETGLRLPSFDTLIAIAKTFKISTDYLLGLENTYNKQTLDLSGLTEAEISALLSLVKAMKQRI